MLWTARGDRPLRGSLRPPGDKSLSHRALIVLSLAEGEARITAANPGRDVASTASCVSACGVDLRGDATSGWTVRGRGPRWRPPTDRLDCGNSGTTARLLSGVLAGQDFTACLDGDASLRARPMRRVARPLRRLGARVEGPDNGEHLPLIVTGPIREGGTLRTEVPSAQVKSALLLAALVAGKDLRVEEEEPSRDHTEILLRALGAELEHGPRFAHLHAGPPLLARDVEVAADPSAAAFPLVAALLVEGSEVTARDVLLNPTRVGFLSVLERMGARPRRERPRESLGESVADLVLAHAGRLRATTVAAGEVVSLVDEVPILAVAAAFAEGTTVFEGVGELRVKESDRLQAVVDLLQAWSVEAEAEGDRLLVHGGSPRPRHELAPFDDHRMAMAHAVLALAGTSRRPGTAARVDLESAAISDPDFARRLEDLQGGA